MRKIYIHGEINEKTLRHVSKKIDKFVAEDIRAPIYVELASEGGFSYPALAIYSKLRAAPCPINITAVGPVMSAATVILAAGDYREMATDSWFMVHESFEHIAGRLNAHQTATTQMLKEEIQWAEILARHSDWTVEQWRQASKKTTFLTAFQLKQINLINGILPSKQSKSAKTKG
jgi:ATP-dependent Clp protease protease subunit